MAFPLVVTVPFAAACEPAVTSTILVVDDEPGVRDLLMELPASGRAAKIGKRAV